MSPPLCRIVRANITQGLAPEDWQVILPEHEKDILTGSSALKVPITVWQLVSGKQCAALLSSPSLVVCRACTADKAEQGYAIMHWGMLLGTGELCKQQGDPVCKSAAYRAISPVLVLPDW